MTRIKQKNIIIVDDHPLILSGLKSLVSQFSNLKIVGLANNGKKALEIIKNRKVDIVFTDIEMDEMDGIELIDVLNELYPKIKIIVITMHTHHYTIRKLLQKKITAILPKSANEEEFRKAFNNFDCKEIYLEESIKSSIIDAIANTNPTKKMTEFKFEISKREHMVLQEIYQGRTTREISESLNKSISTIETHRRNLFIKFGVNNVASLIKVALENNKIEI
jgi:DNA-binding NarL/FixJ family response regulator